MLKRLNRRIRRVKVKLVRVVTGLETAERRVRHHKHQKQRYHELAERTTGLKRERYERLRRRAHKYMRSWQKRQRWLSDKHQFLQVLLDKRLRAKRRWLKNHPPDPTNLKGVVTMDGKQVAAWIAAIAQRCRETGLWGGYIISGWRDPAYSEQLCIEMCGAPSCPGLCAGRSSNHSGSEYPAGAIDITDYYGFEAALRELGETRLRNDLPSDRVHFSNSGK